MQTVETTTSSPNSTNAVLPAVTFGQLIKSWLAKFACHHKWSVHFEINVRDIEGRKIGVEQTLICQHCGKIKKLKL
ncbi:MAG: hypothetical protein ACK518_04505 [bacterium]|jgi:hypothetical protein